MGAQNLHLVWHPLHCDLPRRAGDSLHNHRTHVLSACGRGTWDVVLFWFVEGTFVITFRLTVLPHSFLHFHKKHTHTGSSLVVALLCQRWLHRVVHLRLLFLLLLQPDRNVRFSADRILFRVHGTGQFCTLLGAWVCRFHELAALCQVRVQEHSGGLKMERTIRVTVSQRRGLL